MPDLSLLRSITGGICDAALAPDAWSDVLRQLTEYLGAVGGAYILTNKRTGQVEWISLAGPSAELQSDYVAHFAAVDPYRPLLDGLSPAESRLAVALTAGKRLPDIAAESGLQITTLRTQLSAILKKVGAKRQVDLMRILTSVPVVSTAGVRAE